jgi:hypothetical protein
VSLPSSPEDGNSILDTTKHNGSEIAVSETLCFLASRIPDDGQSPETRNSQD